MPIKREIRQGETMFLKNCMGEGTPSTRRVPSHGSFFGKNWRKLKILKTSHAIRLSSMIGVNEVYIIHKRKKLTWPSG
jgi:hypothetical protein